MPSKMVDKTQFLPCMQIKKQTNVLTIESCKNYSNAESPVRVHRTHSSGRRREARQDVLEEVGARARLSPRRERPRGSVHCAVRL